MTKQQQQTMELSHKYGGNGWAHLQSLGDGMCKVIGFSHRGLGNQAFLAWEKLLSVAPDKLSNPVDYKSPKVPAVLPVDILDELNALRAALADGTKEIVNTRIVDKL